MTESPTTSDNAEYTRCAKAASIRDVIAKLERQGITLDEVEVGEAIEGGFVLEQPNIQTFERKPKEPKPEG